MFVEFVAFAMVNCQPNGCGSATATFSARNTYGVLPVVEISANVTLVSVVRL